MILALQSLNIRYRNRRQEGRSARGRLQHECLPGLASSMALLPIDKARLSRMAGRVVARYIDLVHRTSRIITDPADIDAYLEEHHPAIVAVWHGQFMMAPQAKPLRFPLAIILARHGDAELFAGALSRFNTTLIRGAGAGGRRKDRGGVYALRAAIRTLEEGVSVGMSGDMPPGPARICGLGIVTLARLSGRPIVPLAVATRRFQVLNTWSRMTINLPFGTLACAFGEPIYVAHGADAAALEVARLAVEQGLNRTTARAYELAGGDIRRTLPGHMLAQMPVTAASTAIAPGPGLKLYRAATRMLQPAAPLILSMRERHGKEDRRRRGERLGKPGLPRPDGPLVWIHAASVGEFNAVAPLADALREARPALRFLFTTGTVTSAQVAQRRLHPRDIHQYVPLDAPGFLARFLDHWRPQAVLLTESEIWPNTILTCATRSIPLALVNGRMSGRSFERWERRKGISRPLFSRFDLVLAQNEEMAQRFRDLGAPSVKPVGNLKIDAPPPPVDQEAVARLQAALAGRPFYIAASTHEGEERMLAAAHRSIAVRHPRLCTVIAPRHPERGIAIAEMLKAAGLTVALRSLGEVPGEATDVYIADTIGELGTLYAISPIAFVGGSLVAHGGQNPIEAIQHGSGVISGPHWHNFSDAYEVLLQQRAVLRIADAEELAVAVGRLLGDAAELERLRSAAQGALATLSGALERSVVELVALMPDGKELVRAG